MSTQEAVQPGAGFFEIRLNSLSPQHPLPCDIYLIVNNKATLLRKRSETLTPDRMKALTSHGVNKVLVPLDQRSAYLTDLRSIAKDAGADTQVRGTVIKESAFIQMQELFTNPNVSDVVHGTSTLLTDMVGFLSTNNSAAPSLLKLSAHDDYTFNHSVNVAVYTILLVKKMKGIDPSYFVTAGLSALLHDVGKRDIPASILKKTTPLTQEEEAKVRQHPTLGAKILEGVPSINAKVREVVLQHHENFDGSGYPAGLAGDKISEMARIVAIADSFDALTHIRNGQRSFTAEEAIDLMGSVQPGRFDPGIFKKFNEKTAKKMTMTLPKNFDPCSPAPIQLVPI